MTQAPDSQPPITGAILKSSDSCEDKLIRDTIDSIDRSILKAIDAAASSSVEVLPSATDSAVPDRAFSTGKSDRFQAHDWKKIESEAVTKLKISVSCRVKRLLENEDYAKLLDKYVALLEENEQLKKERNPGI